MRAYTKPSPVVYIDPLTGKTTCNPTLCKEKFTVKKFDIVETNYKWSGGPVTHRFHYSFCEECNRRTITNNDKKLTSESFKRGTNNQGIDPEVNNGG